MHCLTSSCDSEGVYTNKIMLVFPTDDIKRSSDSKRMKEDSVQSSRAAIKITAAFVFHLQKSETDFT